MRECECHGDVYCSDCGATLWRAEARAEKAERELDGLARCVGAALVLATLRPGESMSAPPAHAIVEAVQSLRAERDTTLARLDAATAELEQVRRERNAAASIAAHGTWVWSDTDDNALDGLCDDALVTMRAAQLRALLESHPHDGERPTEARAEKAEREATAYRDALTKVHRETCRGDGHDTPDMTARCIISAWTTARLDHSEDLDTMTKKAVAAIDERDAALAKLAEATQRWRDYEREFILPTFDWAQEIGLDLQALVHTTPGHNCVALLVRHLRQRLASAERALDAAREMLGPCRHDVGEQCSCAARSEEALVAALRAHDSSGSGAADGPRAPTSGGRNPGQGSGAGGSISSASEPAGTTPDPQAPATLADLEKLREECVGRIQRARDLMLAEAVSETREEIAGACERAFARWRENDEAVQLELLGDELRKGGAK